MGSDRKQFNIRISEDIEAQMERVRSAVSERIGMPVNNSDLFRMALFALEEKYAATGRPHKSRKGVGEK